MRRLASLLLVVGLTVLVGGATSWALPPGGTFNDDDQSVHEPAIEAIAAPGITKGCNPSEGNTRFCPDAFVTRGQMAAFLVRAMGYVDDGGGDLFIDDDDSVFEGDIDRLGTAGVTKGCNPSEGNTRFCADAFVTRGQMASFVQRALGLALIDPLDPIVGTWEGPATVPGGWSEIGDVRFEFRADGTYTDISTGDVPATYWGVCDGDHSSKTYEFWGPSPGGGEIGIVWCYPGDTTVQYGRLTGVTTHGERLRFELWNVWKGLYGPVTYDLVRTTSP